jgi:hypothetical protein
MNVECLDVDPICPIWTQSCGPCGPNHVDPVDPICGPNLDVAHGYGPQFVATGVTKKGWGK